MILYNMALEADHLFSTNFPLLIYCFLVFFPLSFSPPSIRIPHLLRASDGPSPQHLSKLQDLRWKLPKKNIEL